MESKDFFTRPHGSLCLVWGLVDRPPVLTFLCCPHLHGSLWEADRTKGDPIRFSYP